MTDRVEGEGLRRLAALTARLASTARLDEIVDAVLGEIVDLGFGAVWMAVLDEPTGNLLTLKEVIDGIDTTHEMPAIFMLDTRQPIGRGFREGRMINIVAPDALFIMERPDEVVRDDQLALPRVIYDHLRGHPFACGPLLGSRRQPVGALGLSSYRGKQPIPDHLFESGLLRAFMDHLGIAMERALHLTRLERVNANLMAAQNAIANDARVKAIGELAAAVAHDLNNLSGIAMMSVSIGRRSPAEAFDMMPRIEQAVRAIGDLVGRLQRVTRPGELTASGSTDLHQVVEDIVTMTSPLLREHSITLDLDLPQVPHVLVDVTLAHQVILNLILNAQDALDGRPAEQRRLRIRLRDDDDIVRLIVADNGPGIAPEILPQLFRPFVTTKQGGHVGLGLAAAHASLQHFGGQITARNNTGGGAVFEVTFPAMPSSDIPLAKPASSPPLAQRAGKILAVDDDPDVVFIVRAYLQPCGYDVVTVTTGDQVIDLAAEQAFDLILCDVGMPKRSGLELCELLRDGGYRGKLVLMTGWDSQRVKSDPRAAKCDTLIAKPFLGSDLLEVIDTLLA